MEINNNKIDINQQLNDAFIIYKKIAFPAGICFLLLYFIIVSMSFVALNYFFAIEELTQCVKNFKPENLILSNQIIYILFLVIFAALISPFLASIFKMAEDADNNIPVQISTFFTYVNSTQFIAIITTSAIITFLSIAINLLLKTYIVSIYADFLGTIASLSLSVFTYLAMPLVALGKYPVIKAFKHSFVQVKNNLLPIVLLMIIAFVGAFVGLLVFCIGIIFTLPLLYAVNYAVYKKLESKTDFS